MSRQDPPERFTAQAQPHAIMPLGGIGTGNLGIGADGGLRQWQLQGPGNHTGDAPWSFFAIRACRSERPVNELRILQSNSILAERSKTPLVRDNLIPKWQRELVGQVGGFETVTMRATYPRARLEFRDPAVPVVVQLEALTPLAPLDVETSGIPAALFTFILTNQAERSLHGWIGATVHNSVGGDGAVNPSGLAHPGYGGNTNRLRRTGWTKLIAENLSLPVSDPRAGQIVLAADDPAAPVLPQWTDPRQYLDFLARRAQRIAQPLHPAARSTDAALVGLPLAGAPAPPSPPGLSWCGAITTAWALEPGESTTRRFVLAWHFPNRYVNFEQLGSAHPEWGSSRFWLGNAYAARYADAEAVADDVTGRWPELTARTDRWCSAMTESSLDRRAANRLAAQPVSLRSPTCFIDGQGRFFAHEGVHGESTAMWAGEAGGSCPLNCTHVWNYVQAVAHLFPGLERSMRRSEFDVLQAPDGHLPHRLLAPVYLPQMWDEAIGGPQEPALDGMLGAVLKTYREVRAGWSVDILRGYWPNLARLMSYIASRWDPGESGVLHGVQPSTHDVDLAGVNPFMGTLWLAALRAYQAMAAILGREDAAAWAAARFEAGSKAYDAIMWNGEYYRQVLEEGDTADNQWCDGCLADQLIGQWWAHELALGHILPADRVRQALAAVVRHNLRRGFEGFDHPYRVFADGDDSALLVCTWPRGARPSVPILYADEVWSGSEYEVAALCLREGLVEQGAAILDALWSRHDGRRRNPFNEVECGDHYSRAMSGWSVLRAITGLDYDAVTATVSIRPTVSLLSARAGVIRLPLFAATGWGSLELSGDQVEVKLAEGSLRIDRLVLNGSSRPLPGPVTALAGQPLIL